MIQFATYQGEKVQIDWSSQTTSIRKVEGLEIEERRRIVQIRKDVGSQWEWVDVAEIQR